MTVLPDADLGSITGLLRWLREIKKYRPGVVAVAAAPHWSGAREHTVDGDPVTIHAAPSVLAIRDAIRDRADGQWTVILTDRPSTEIPDGVADHLVSTRLLNLDPFPLLRNAFNATRQEFGLLGDRNVLARAMLRELGDKPTPAPSAVLTNEHVFAELAKTHFGMALPDFTPHHVAVWSLNVDHTDRYTRWAATADAGLVAQFIAWLGRRLGDLGPVLTTAWAARGPADMVPLGLVAGLLTGPRSEEGTRARTRLEIQLDNSTLTDRQLDAWGAVATLAVDEAADPSAALTAAEAWVHTLQAEPFAIGSDVLPSALGLRVASFAEHLAVAVDARENAAKRAAADNTWEAVRAHRDARVDQSDSPRDVQVGAAALRLLRRIDGSWPTPTSLVDWLDSYRTDLAWVDGAIDDAYVGADDPRLAAAAHRLVGEVRGIRAGLDAEFARLLASAGTQQENGSGAPLYIENILDAVVKPLTVQPSGPSAGSLGLDTGLKISPVLLIVADGMDVAAANELVADIVRQRRWQWNECAYLPDREEDGLRRQTGLAALPTVTKYSRCSLLTGALAAGGQDRERVGFADWLAHHRLRGTGQVLFHKGDLDAVAQGHSLAAEVRTALQDTRGRPVIACVLNDIDDALDRSDPIGTTWSVGSFKRLDALLTEAAAVGRSVVLTSDHGHVVERREQPSAQRGDQISARYRPTSVAAEADEVYVEGPRVLADGNRAVLAVDEQLRYTGIKAGYHGGAALSEAAIPISILVNGAIPGYLGVAELPSGQPQWWSLEVAEPSTENAEFRALAARSMPTPARPAKAAPAKKAKPAEATLFDFGGPDVVDPADAGESAVEVVDQVGRLLADDLFARQHKQFARRALTKQVIGTVLREAMAANGIVPAVRITELCGLKPTQARSAVAWLAQILNVDGVIVVEQQGDEAVIATSLLFEQFGVS